MHKCQCKHEEVKLCNTCKIVYCTTCGEEWVKQTYWNYYYPNAGISTSTGFSGISTAGTCACGCSNHSE